MSKSKQMDSFVRSLAIGEDSLSNSKAWRERRSDSDRFRPADFGLKAENQVDAKDIKLDFWPHFWKPVRLGIAFLTVAIAIIISMRESFVYFLIGASTVQINVGILIGFIVVVLFIIYTGVRFATASGGTKITTLVFERNQYVCPGWQSCYFSFGSHGIAVNGTHFLFFVEWEAINEIQEFSDDSRFVIHNRNGEMLTIPKRFFEQDNGGDITWGADGGEVRALINQYKPKAAEWRAGKMASS